MELNQAAEALIAAITAIVNLPWAVPTVLMATAFLKRYIPTEILSARTLSLAVAVVVWVLFTVARKYGVGEDVFRNYMDTIYTIGAAILGLAGTTVGAGALYDTLNKHDLPLGGSRVNTQSTPHR